MPTLSSGDKAPNFTLLDQHGQKQSLSSLRGKKVMIYFYPKADTGGCTTQSCAVRDNLTALAQHRVVVFGISPDQPKKQLAFDNKYTLGFPLLADVDHAVADAFGVWGEKSMYGRKYMGIIRSAFLIDEKGKLIDVFYKVSPAETVPKVMKAIQ